MANAFLKAAFALQDKTPLKKRLITSGFALVVLIGLSQEAMAICTVTGGVASGVIQIQIPNITVGRDLPGGTELYRQEYSANSSGFVRCSSASSPLALSYRGRMLSTPLRLSDWSTGSFGGKVFETRVAGIGVAFMSAGTWLPDTVGTRVSGCGNTNPCDVTINNIGLYALVLVKIGNVIGNGVILGSSLPSIESFIFQDGVSYPYSRVNFSGAINVVSRTCQTSNVEVDMGIHKVSEFAQTNSTTSWKDFSINLINCPAFFGISPIPGNNTNWTVAINNSNTPSHFEFARQPNSIQVNLIGTVPPISASQGILALNPAGASFGEPATGVGVQVANSAGTPVAIGPGAWIASGITTQAAEGMNYTIPLKARYIRTTGPVGPGQANATVQFTINYQ